MYTLSALSDSVSAVVFKEWREGLSCKRVYGYCDFDVSSSQAPYSSDFTIAFSQPVTKFKVSSHVVSFVAITFVIAWHKVSKCAIGTRLCSSSVADCCAFFVF